MKSREYSSRILTCKNHPELRWSCKDQAYTPGQGYNGCRNIFFNGISRGRMFDDNSGLDCTCVPDDPNGEHVSVIDGRRYSIVQECNCCSRDLILAPEDRFVGRKRLTKTERTLVATFAILPESARCEDESQHPMHENVADYFAR